MPTEIVPLTGTESKDQEAAAYAEVLRRGLAQVRQNALDAGLCRKRRNVRPHSQPDYHDSRSYLREQA